MVFSLGNGRMAAMARILAAGNVSKNDPEVIGQQKLAAQSMYRELREADEANLLDAEDMHVFGLEPMADPLHLVCCNACKKPVKTSQYAAHSELCRSLKYVGEIAVGDGGIKNRKPQKKERKKSLIANSNQVTTAVGQGRYESLNVHDVSKSETRLGKQPVVSSSPYSHITGKSLCVNVASKQTDPSLFGIPPPTKRSKVSSSQHPSLGDDELDKPSGLTKFTSCWIKDFQPQSASGTVTKLPNYDAVVSKCDGRNNSIGLVKKDFPIPLATKIYYSQRSNHRLRSAVAQMYYASSNEGISCDMSPDVSLSHVRNQLKASTQMDEMTDKERDHSTFTPGQICEAEYEGCLENTNMSTQFPVSNLLVPQTPPIGLLGSKYLSNPYSLGGNSGKTIGTLQQQNGSVHVL